MTNKEVSFPWRMKSEMRVSALLVTLLLLPGCLSALVDDVDDIIMELSPEGDWPQLDLGERTRSSPTLETYDDCNVLLENLKDALWEQTLVEIDQNAYWNWASPVLRMGVGLFDDMMVEDGAVAEASMDGAATNGGTAPSSSGGEDRAGTCE